MKFDNIAFVWTYECNTDCSFCYAEKYIQPYKWKELSFERFKEIALKLKKNGVKYIMFIWWEPALWKHLNNAIKFAKENWFVTTVLSNAMIEIKEMPDRFYININVLFLTKHKNILKNISKYSKRCKVWLIYNVWDINKFNLELIKKLLGNFWLPISLWLIFNDSIDKEKWEYFYKLARYLKEEAKVDIESNWPIPICIFSEEQYVYLKYNINLTSTCWTPSFINTDAFTVINPDWETILPCPPLSFSANIDYLLNNDMAEYIKKFSPHTKKLRNTVPEMCNWCEYHWNKCQYWCLVNKYSSEELKNWRILI